MKKEDLIYTNCREMAYEACSYKEKSVLYAAECLLLESNHIDMGGMDCLVAYIVTASNKGKLEDAQFDMCHTIEEVEASFHINYEENVRDYLCELLEEHSVIILGEERAYLRPQTKDGANLIMRREQENMLYMVANPKESDNYHMYMMPKAAENYGRVAFNYQLFMSGQKG